MVPIWPFQLYVVLLLISQALVWGYPRLASQAVSLLNMDLSALKNLSSIHIQSVIHATVPLPCIFAPGLAPKLHISSNPGRLRPPARIPVPGLDLDLDILV
jgi:hypothetical protein